MGLIDADKLYGRIKSRVIDNFKLVDIRYEGYLAAMAEVEDMINELEEVDRETERHGKWDQNWADDDGDARELHCSVCGFRHVYFYDMPKNYCPNCGARMDCLTCQTQVDCGDYYCKWCKEENDATD